MEPYRTVTILPIWVWLVAKSRLTFIYCYIRTFYRLDALGVTPASTKINSTEALKELFSFFVPPDKIVDIAQLYLRCLYTICLLYTSDAADE